MMGQLTKAQLESRQRMARLGSEISKVICDEPDITCSEVLLVLGKAVTEWAGFAWSDDIVRNEDLSQGDEKP